MKNCSIEFPDFDEPNGELSLSVEGRFNLFLNSGNIKDMAFSKNENGYMIMNQFFVFFVDFKTGDKLLNLLQKQKMELDE